jgi:hypothetical protein
MCRILPFARLKVPPPQRPRRGAPAEIVIFPGVRVEYHPAPPLALPVPPPITGAGTDSLTG